MCDNKSDGNQAVVGAAPALPHCYPYPRPAVTVDVTLFTFRHDRLQVLLIQRGREPFGGCWALPGGFVDEDEDLQAAAVRELRYGQLALAGVVG